jgi:hypothetical protein
MFALLCHGAVLWTAFRGTYSTSGFLVTGLGLVLLLDRYVLRVLPWLPFAWKKEGGIRTGCFIGGAMTFYVLRPGIVPLGEAAYRGLMVCLLVFLLEELVRRASRSRGSSQVSLGLRVLVLIALLLLVPVVAALHPLPPFRSEPQPRLAWLSRMSAFGVPTEQSWPPGSSRTPSHAATLSSVTVTDETGVMSRGCWRHFTTSD